MGQPSFLLGLPLRGAMCTPGTRFVLLSPPSRSKHCKQCRAQAWLVCLYAASPIDFFTRGNIPAVGACGTATRSTASFIPPLHLTARGFGHGSCFGETAFESSIGCAVARDKGTRYPAASIGNRV